MKLKELKNLAKKIAQQEKAYQNATNTEERMKAEEEIMRLTSKVESFDDLMLLDELIQELLG
jgi:hypothetical protein